ncbi:potassium channel family protein [Hydrogenophaga sp. 5NK40-0174]|uniref:potassium channel family protein n=1 Tax=Hydrogenophaga sp. 5NK40-0174 TaxID=3127649 RepID=UPI0031078DBB
MSRGNFPRWHLVRRGLWYSLALALVILLAGGVGFLWLEPGITTIEDGLWLAFTTAATVGYGDLVPHTPMGRAFSVVVVLLGLTVLSLVTASLAAVFVEREVQQDERLVEFDLLVEIRALRKEVKALREEVGQVTGQNQGIREDNYDAPPERGPHSEHP